MSTALGELIGNEEDIDDNETSVYFEVESESEDESDEESINNQTSEEEHDQEENITQFTNAIENQYF